MTAERLDIVVTERGTRTVSRNITSVGKAGRVAGTQVDFLRRSLFLLGGAAIVRKIIALADSFVLLTNQIKVASGETDNLAETTDRLFKISNRTRTAISGNVQLFQRLSFAADELGASQEDLFKFVEQTGKLLAIQGGSAQSARGALIQLTQAMGSGIVRGEEFNSILEGAFSVALAAAKGLDRAGGSVSKLRTLIIKGQVTSDEFFRAILSQSKETDRIFAQTVATIGQSFNILGNAATKFFGELGQSTGTVTRLASALQLLAANFETVATVVGVVAGVLLVKLASVAIPAVVAGIGTMAAGLLGLVTTILPALVAAAIGAFATIAAVAAANGKSIGETFEDLKDKITDLFSSITEPVEAVNEFERRIGTFNQEIRSLGGVSKLTQEQLKDMVAGLQTLRDEINRRNLVQKLIAPASEGVKQMSDQVTTLERAITALQKRIVDATAPAKGAKPLELSKTETTSLKKLQDQLNPVGGALRETKEAQDLLSKAFVTGKITAEQYDFLLERLGKESAKSFKDAVEEMNPALARQRELLKSIQAPAKDYKETLEDLNILLAKGSINQDQFTRLQRDAKIALLETQTTAAAGAERAFLKMRRDAEDFAGATEEVITNAFSAAEDAIVKFAQTGKFEFGDFVRQVSADLLRLGTREIFGALTGAKGGGGGVGGFFTGLFSGGGGVGSFISSLFGFQNGGGFTVGASTSAAAIPGVDNRLVALRARDGETVSVTPRGQEPAGGRPLSIQFNFPQGTDVDSFRRSQGQVAARTAAALQRASTRNN